MGDGINNRRTAFPQSPRRRTLRRRGALIGLACAAVAAVHAGVWYALSERARDRILAQRAAWDSEHVRIDHAGMRRSGYPFAVRWTLDRPRLDGRWTYGAARIQGRAITLGYALPAPFVLEFRIAGLSAVAESHRSGALTVRAAHVAGQITEAGPDIVAADYRLADIVADGHGAAARGIGTVRFAAGSARPDRFLALALDEVTSPHLEGRSPVGSGRFEFRGRLLGEIGEGRATDLAAWRDAGGIVEIETIRAESPAMAVGFNGTAALDGTMRPLVAGVAELRGFSELIDGLIANGVLDRRDAALASAVLPLLARPADDGGPPVLRLPVTIQNGKARAGPLGLGTVGSILR